MSSQNRWFQPVPALLAVLAVGVVALQAQPGRAERRGDLAAASNKDLPEPPAQVVPVALVKTAAAGEQSEAGPQSLSIGQTRADRSLPSSRSADFGQGAGGRQAQPWRLSAEQRALMREQLRRSAEDMRVSGPGAR